jgi:hypothetical protein
MPGDGGGGGDVLGGGREVRRGVSGRKARWRSMAFNRSMGEWSGGGSGWPHGEVEEEGGPIDEALSQMGGLGRQRRGADARGRAVVSCRAEQGSGDTDERASGTGLGDGGGRARPTGGPALEWVRQASEGRRERGR